MEIVLLTETSVAPSLGETAETVGDEVSEVAIVASSSSLGEEQENTRAITDSKLANALAKLLNFRFSKTPFSKI